MNKILLAGVALFGLASIGAAGPIGSVGVSPGGTFLEQSAEDNCSWGNKSAQCTGASFFNPTVVNLLTGLSQPVNPGDLLEIIVTGRLCYTSAICSAPPNIGGIFSSTSTLQDSSNSNRVTGHLNTAGQASMHTTMFFGSASNMQVDDFEIPGTLAGLTVTVPEGAHYLFLGTYDSFFADNSGEVSVSFVAFTTPEPGTYVLVMAGLGALVLVRRRAATKLIPRTN